MLRILAVIAALGFADALKLPATPVNPPTQAFGRRAAVVFGGSLLTAPLSAFAAAKKPAPKTLAEEELADESALEKEESSIKSLEGEINKERATRFSTELKRKKLEEERDDAFVSGDKAKAKELAQQVVKLKEEEAKLSKQIIAMTAEDSKEVEAEKKLKVKVQKDKAALDKEGDAEEIAEESQEVLKLFTAEEFAALPPQEQKKLKAQGYVASK